MAKSRVNIEISDNRLLPPVNKSESDQLTIKSIFLLVLKENIKLLYFFIKSTNFKDLRDRVLSEN